MKLSGTDKPFIEANQSLLTLQNRMITREGKSEETLQRYLDGVKLFTRYMKAKTPDKALKLFSDSEDRTNQLDAFIDWLIAEKVKPVSLKAAWQGVKKWLTANRVNGIDYAYISRPKAVSQIRDRIPTTDELQLILNNKVSLRDKAYFMLAASSGLRIGTLTTLQIKDFSAAEELGLITVNGAPGRKLAEGKQYFTFCTPETRKIIEQYIATRPNATPDAPLFTKENTEQPVAYFSQNVSRQWRILVRRAALLQKADNHRWISLHTHTLRKFFQTRCKLGGCRSDFVDFWMGHTFVKMENYLNESYFRPNLQEHIAEYRKAVCSLSVFEGANQAKLEKETDQLKAKVGVLEDLVKQLYAQVLEDVGEKAGLNKDEVKRIIKEKIR